jgi:hypothetical protein
MSRGKKRRVKKQYRVAPSLARTYEHGQPPALEYHLQAAMTT